MLFCTQNGIFGVGGYWSQKFWGSKNRFFWIFEKCFLITFYPWIWPGNVFCRLWGRVFDNFQVAMVVLWPHAKIWNFQKIQFLRFFRIFWCWSFWTQKGTKTYKKVKFFKDVFFRSQRCFQIPRMTWFDHLKTKILCINKIPFFTTLESFYMTPVGNSHRVI